MITFIKTNKIELLMWILVLFATAGFGIFVLSHTYGLLSVLMTVCLGIFTILAIIISFEVYLKHRLHNLIKTHITIQNMHKLTGHTLRIIKKWGNFKLLLQNSRLKMTSLKLKR